MTLMTEDELIRAHSAGPPAVSGYLTSTGEFAAAMKEPVATARHIPQPHELRNAWQTAKQLEERLDVANQPVLRRIAMYIREQTFLALMEIEGYVEAPES